MDFTQLWYQLVDMSKSDQVFANIAGFSVSESQVVWIAGAILGVIAIFFIRGMVSWVLGPSGKKAGSSTVVLPPKADKELPPLPQTPTAIKTEETKTANSPSDLLADTSENRRRSLYDYVTPDTIHADVMKQTVNNDYPYQTLKPDQLPTAPKVTTQPPAAPTQVQTQVTTAAAPVAPAPIIPPVTPPSVTTPAAQPTPEKTLTEFEFSSIPPKTAEVPQKPTTVNTSTPVTPAQQPTITTPTLPPINIPAAKPETMPQTQNASFVDLPLIQTNGAAQAQAQNSAATGFTPSSPLLP